MKRRSSGTVSGKERKVAFEVKVGGETEKGQTCWTQRENHTMDNGVDSDPK